MLKRFKFKKNLFYARDEIYIDIIYKRKTQKTLFMNVALLNESISEN